MTDYPTYTQHMTPDEINQISEIRCQHAILVYVRGYPRWLLVDRLPCTLGELAAALNTDDWEKYCNSELAAVMNGKPLPGYDMDADVLHTWSSRGNNYENTVHFHDVSF